MLSAKHGLMQQMWEKIMIRFIEMLLGILTMVMGIIVLMASVALEVANKVMRSIYENWTRKH